MVDFWVGLNLSGIQSAFRGLKIPPIILNGIQLYVDAGNILSYPTTGTAWSDLSGNSRTGTLTNGPTYSSANGGAIVLDGTNDYVNFGDVVAIADSLTVSVWFKFPTGFGTTWQIILARRDAGSTGMNYDMNYNPSINILQFGYSGAGNFNYKFTSVPLTTNFTANIWTNICGVLLKNGSNTDVLIYKDGSLLTSTTLTENVTAKLSMPLNIGAYGGGLSPATGSIAEASIYNRALSAAEVLQNYNALRWRYGV